jgi:hypothetical protein
MITSMINYNDIIKKTCYGIITGFLSISFYYSVGIGIISMSSKTSPASILM